MNNVTFHFNGVTNNILYQVKVNIYDNNILVCSGTTIGGCISFCLVKNKAYIIEARLLRYYLCTSFYVNNNINDLYFNINCNYIYNRRIIFNLRDSYYNIPIERGELILWQKQ